MESFKYLGVILSKNGRYIKAIKENIDKARKAMFELRRTFKQKFIPIDCQIELFGKTIEPILLYGAEIWGFENIKLIEQFRLKCFKQILKLKQSTPSYMIYGELGKLPLTIYLKMKMIKFWGRLISCEPKEISQQFLELMNYQNTTQ